MKYEEPMRKTDKREHREKTPFGEFGRLRKNPTPTKNQKCEKRPQMPFSGHGSAFFGFLASSSSSWPDSRRISPNLGRFRAIFLFLCVIVPMSISEKFHFFPPAVSKKGRRKKQEKEEERSSTAFVVVSFFFRTCHIERAIR